MNDSRLKKSGNTRRRVSGRDSKTVNRPGRPVGDREAKQSELLAAATSVIAQEGYAGASLRKVAQRAGCTTGAVTYYFANKQEMVTAVAKGLWDEFDTLLESRQEKVGIRTIIERWLDWTTAHSDSRLALFQLLALARHEPACASITRRRYSRFRREFASILERGQREGMVRSDIAADVLADQLCAIGDGWMMMLPVEPGRFKPSRRKVLLDSVMTTISPPGT